ncbi:MAG: peptide chain release factor N(5)-glutamine methyltransferase [Gallionellaceae bacterium]
MMQRILNNILRQDSGQLQAVLGLDPSSARIEVQCLLQQVLQVKRAYLFAHPEHILNDDEEAAYQVLLQRRLGGEPIAYILEKREFFGMNLTVNSATLIPRPDTELLVELALQRMDSGDMQILDLGTGSGAIALALARQHPAAKIWACDASGAALAVAQHNARLLNIGNVNFMQSNWFADMPNLKFDLIVSNPPYIAENDTHLSQGDVRFEPLSALASGADGLDDIRRIISHAAAYLEKNGWLILEHGYDQAVQVRALLQEKGFAEVFSAQDISGIERCTGGKLLCA